jgi:effector-binding domain-containing protein
MPLLGKVWEFLRSGGQRTGHNVVVYQTAPQGGVEVVEAGVQVFDSITSLPDGLVASATPAGRVAKTLHVGPYSGLAAASASLAAWCAANDHGLAGQSWEVYGDWDQDESKLETEIYLMLHD